MTKWITQAEYARRYKVSRQAVWQAVKGGRIPNRAGKVDADFNLLMTRLRDPGMIGAADDSELSREIQEARLENLKARAAVQRWKDAEYREDWRRQNMAHLTVLLIESFETFPAVFDTLTITPKQAADLHAIWDRCMQDFKTRMAERCAPYSIETRSSEWQW